MTSKRLISIQEAVHEINRLSLTLCSDDITSVSLLSCAKLRKSSERKPRDLAWCYGNRDVKYEHYSLDRYFYEVFIKDKYEKDEDSGRVKDRMLLYNGLNCRPCHPIDFNYARGMLVMRKPWSVRKPLDIRNKQATIDESKKMLEEKKVPSNVWTEYKNATIHRCQGLEAGFDEGDRWTRMVMDPSDIEWEICHNPGTLYVATSRGKTLGSRGGEWGNHPQDSAIHFTGDEISFNRIRDCAKKSNGALCEMVKKRERWVKHLMERAEQTAETYNVDMANKILNTTYKIAIEQNLIPDRETLTTRIGNMIKSPNSTWAEKKPEWELPRTYFDG